MAGSLRLDCFYLHAKRWCDCVNIHGLNGLSNLNSLVYPTTVVRVARWHSFASSHLAAYTIWILNVVGVIFGCFISSGIRALLCLATWLKLGDNLNGVVVLGLWHFGLGTIFWREEISLRRSNLRVVSLHLNLMVGICSGCVKTWGFVSTVARGKGIYLRYVWLSIRTVDGASVMGSGCLGKQIVLVRRRLQMLSINNDLLRSSRNLNLNIRMLLVLYVLITWYLTTPNSDLLQLNIKIFDFVWTVEVLSRLIHVVALLMCDQVHVGVRTAPSRASSSLSSAVSVSFDTFNDVSSLWINFWKRIISIGPILVSNTWIAWVNNCVVHALVLGRTHMKPCAILCSLGHHHVLLVLRV